MKYLESFDYSIMIICAFPFHTTKVFGSFYVNIVQFELINHNLSNKTTFARAALNHQQNEATLDVSAHHLSIMMLPITTATSYGLSQVSVLFIYNNPRLSMVVFELLLFECFLKCHKNCVGVREV